MTGLPTFIHGNLIVAGSWHPGRDILGVSDPPPGQYDPATRLTLSTAAAGKAVSLIYTVPDGAGNRLLALRRPVPGRVGDQIIMGVEIPNGVELSCLDAMRARFVLGVRDEDLEDLLSRRPRKSAPFTLDPFPLEAILAAPLPQTSNCDPGKVTELIAHILTIWDVDWKVRLVVDGQSEEQIAEYFAAAFQRLPPACLRQLTFSTLEGNAKAAASVLGRVEAYWESRKQGTEKYEQLSLTEPSPPNLWESYAATLHELPRNGWQFQQIDEATSARDLIARLAAVTQLIADPDSASDETLAGWLADGTGPVKDISPSRIVRLLCAFPGAVPAAVLGSALLDREAAEQFRGAFPELRARIPDAQFAQLLPALPGEVRDEVFSDLCRSCRTWPEIHPGCSQPGCPLVAEFEQFALDQKVLDWLSDNNPGLIPEKAFTPEERLRYYLRARQASAPPNIIGVCDLSQIVAESLTSVDPLRVSAEQFARRVALLGDPALRVCQDLLARQDTFDFAAGPLLRTLLQGQPQYAPDLQVSLLFNHRSGVFQRYGVPRQLGAVSDASGQAGAGKDFRGLRRLTVEQIAQFGLAENEADYLANCTRQVGQPNYAVLLSTLPSGRRGVYGGAEAHLELSDSLVGLLLAKKASADLLLARMLPAIDPDLAHVILRDNIGKIASLYGFPVADPRNLAPEQPGAAHSGRVPGADRPAGAPRGPDPARGLVQPQGPGMGPRPDTRVREVWKSRAVVAVAALVMILVAGLFVAKFSAGPGDPATTPSPTQTASDPGSEGASDGGTPSDGKASDPGKSEAASEPAGGTFGGGGR